MNRIRKGEVCSTCRTLIYEGEVSYNTETRKGRKFPFGLRKNWENSASWVQCSWCYDQWQAELAEYNRNTSGAWKWGGIISVFLSLMAGVVAGFFFKEEGKFYRREIKDFNFSAFGYVAGFVFLSVLLLTYIVKIVRYPSSQADRYKIRERERERTKDEEKEQE